MVDRRNGYAESDSLSSLLDHGRSRSKNPVGNQSSKVGLRSGRSTESTDAYLLRSAWAMGHEADGPIEYSLGAGRRCKLHAAAALARSLGGADVIACLSDGSVGLTCRCSNGCCIFT